MVDLLCSYLRLQTATERESEADVAAQARGSSDVLVEQASHEVEVRATVQHILARRCRLDDNFWPGMRFDLRNAELDLVDFSECIVESADFTGTKFRGSARFESAILGDATFEGATFEESANFYSCKFVGSFAKFNHVTFLGSATFQWARFMTGAHFEGANFSNEFMQFDQVEFATFASFDGVKLPSVTFHRAKITNGNFNDATFGGPETSILDFCRTKLSQTMFNNATFHGYVAFNDAAFESCSFYEAKFHEKALFHESSFKDIDFEHATFGGEGDFWQCKFSGNVDFAHVKGKVDLNGARATRSGRLVWPTGWATQEAEHANKRSWVKVVFNPIRDND